MDCDQKASKLEEAKPATCDALSSHYGIASLEKKRFLQSAEAVALFRGLPYGVANTVRHGFLNGLAGIEVADWDQVVDYFNEHSLIVRTLIKTAQSYYSTLEIIYTKENISGAIDNYFWNCLGGQALRNRLEAVIQHLCSVIADRVRQMGKQLILNLGSGSGRDTIEMCLRTPSVARSVVVECIDTDPEAIAKGKKLAELNKLDNFQFTEYDIYKLKYRAEADFGLLIGILVPLKADICIRILRIIKRYFKPGAQVVSACLLDEQLKKDLLCSYLIKEIADWQLDYKPKGLLKTIYEEAGYRWGGSFSDTPTDFYEIGIGIV